MLKSDLRLKNEWIIIYLQKQPHTQNTSLRTPLVKKVIEKTRSIFLLILLLFVSHYSEAQTVRLCFTNSSPKADLVLRYTDFLPTADICVWAGRTTLADVDVCFIKYPTSRSISISLVDNPALADYRIYITNDPLQAGKTISITSRMTAADICVGIWDSPTSFTRDIYIKGTDPANLLMEQKVAILYYLGALNKGF